MLFTLKRTLALLAFLILSVNTPTLLAEKISGYDALLQWPDYQEVAISPDGEHIAFVYDNGEQVRVYVFEIKTMKLIGNHGLAKYSPNNIFWVNNDRLAMYMLAKSVRYTKRWNTGMLYAVNKDGSNGEYLQSASVINPLVDNRKNMLVARKDKVYTLDVYTSKLRWKKGAPDRRTSEDYLADKDGVVKVSHAVDNHRNQSLYRLDEKGDWVEVDGLALGSEFTLLRLNSKGDKFYYLNNASTNTLSLFEYDLKTDEAYVIFENKANDISDVYWDFRTNQPVAVRIEPNYPEYHFLETESSAASDLKAILGVFEGNRVSIASTSRDGGKLVVETSNDVSPGHYYLFDSNTKVLHSLVQVLKEVNRKELAYKQPIRFSSFDGVMIDGFITYPNNSQGKKVPLVTLVHGGPIGVRDLWEFESETQILAMHGYAVLQVNYRGSSGRGNAFQKSGHGQWGTGIQQDIYAATQWAIKQGRVDKDKVCIMGGSFGAYSAIQSSTMYPELYKCAIANAGVYDLTVLADERSNSASKRIIRKYLGGDKKSLAEQSPIFYTERLKSPILLSHGEKDFVASYEHVEKLIDALEDNNIAFEFLTFSRELHGYGSLKNRKTYMKNVLKFLDRSLN